MSERIPYDTLNSSLDIRFTTENFFLIGFEIIIRGLGQGEAEKESKSKAGIVKELLTVESGMAVRTSQTSCEEIGNQFPRVVQSTSIHPYKIEGKIGKLDLNDATIQKFFKSTPSKDLKFLSDAILLKYFGFLEYSIRESYKITEDAGKIEERFKVLRNTFSHPTLEEYWFDIFDKYYGDQYFEYKLYDKNNKKFVIDFESNRTQQKLDNLATELIEICKNLLGLK